MVVVHPRVRETDWMRVAGAHVLLTGATGDIGRHLAERLSRGRGHGHPRRPRTYRARGARRRHRGRGGPGRPDRPGRPSRARRPGSRPSCGPIDVLVNNAGTETVGHLADLTSADLEHLVTLNLLAPAELCRQVLPGMTRRGRGHLVNISSLAGVATFPGLATYGADQGGPHPPHVRPASRPARWPDRHARRRDRPGRPPR